LTARDTVHETIEGIKGCKWLYLKPFSFEELIEQKFILEIRMNWLFWPCAIQIDIANSVSSNETLVQPNREFDLLCYLVKTKKCVLEIRRWDIHFDYDTGVIDVL
jgi:DNA-binding response OmpR family regulator